MNTGSVPGLQTTNLIPILVGVGVAGTLDLLCAFVASDFNVPRVIAAGLFGLGVIRSHSLAFWILGVALPFFIAFVAATVYSIASQKLEFLKEHFEVSGRYSGSRTFS